MKKLLLSLTISFLSTVCLSQTIIKMKSHGGVSIVPCKVNGLNLSFIFDTGASDVTISLTEALFMLKNGYLSKEDIKGTSKYSNANGEINEGYTIVLKEIEFAGLKLYNVEASIVKNLDAPLLLGQSAISKLGTIQLDLASNTLVILNGKSSYDYITYKPIKQSFNEWSSFRGNAKHTGYYNGKAPQELTELTWKFKTEHVVSSSPAVADGMVFFGSEDTYLYAVDIKTGQENWKFKTDNAVTSSPAVADGMVFFGSFDNYLYAVDIKTGQEKWKFKTKKGVPSDPAVADGMVFFGSWDNYLYAVDIKTGQEKWKFKTNAKISLGPAVADGMVFFGSYDGYLYAVDIKTGQEKWKFKTDAEVGSSPAVADGIVFFGSYDGYLYSVDIKTGQEKWKFKTNAKVSSGPAFADGMVFFGSWDKYLYAVK